jgi:hypothetical protein
LNKNRACRQSNEIVAGLKRQPGMSMFAKSILSVVGVVLLTPTFAQTQSGSPENPDIRALRMSDAEQVAFVKAKLDAGDLMGWPMLAINRSELILPVIEKKIEQVLASANPKECFSDKTVDPSRFIGLTEFLITGAGDKEALKVVRRLLALDKERFGPWVSHVFSAAWSSHAPPEPFILAYWALDQGDPVLAAKVAAWAEDILQPLENDVPIAPRPRWAAAMVKRYGAVPTSEQWAKDPIVSRLKPATAEAQRDRVLRLAQDVWENSPRHVLAMSDDEQVAYVRTQIEKDTLYDHMEAVGALAHEYGPLILPVLVAEIERTLKSLKPSDCPENHGGTLNYPYLLIIAFEKAGTVDALRYVPRLSEANTCQSLKLAAGILGAADERREAAEVLHRGLELGSPDIDRQMIGWLETRLAEPSFNIPSDFRRRFATDMAKRYGGVPTMEQWARDPVASRLKPNAAGLLRSDIVSIKTEAADIRGRQ